MRAVITALLALVLLLAAIPAWAKPELIIESNSIGLGYYADNTGAPNYTAVGSPPFPDGFVAVMLSALGGSSAWTLVNNSIDGGTTANLTAADPTAGYPQLSNGASAYVIFFFEVTNDYDTNGGNIATCLTNYEAWYAGWRAAAVTAAVSSITYIVFATPLPRTSATWDTWEVDRFTISRQVQALGLADAIVPFGQDPIMGSAATLTNATYYRPIDFIHPLLQGHAILGALGATGVQTSLRTWRGTPSWPIWADFLIPIDDALLEAAAPANDNAHSSTKQAVGW